jgi:hypothetical protein
MLSDQCVTPKLPTKSRPTGPDEIFFTNGQRPLGLCVRTAGGYNSFDAVGRVLGSHPHLKAARGALMSHAGGSVP